MRRGQAIASVAALAAVLPHAASAADAPVAVGSFPVDNAGALYYAQSLGYFRDAGLDVAITALGGSTSAFVAAVAGGSLNVGISNVPTLALARQHGLPMKFIAPAAVEDAHTATDQIMVLKDSPINTGADFAGKTIGIFGVKELGQYAAMAWIDAHGGDSKNVKFIEIAIPQMIPALQAQRVDAIALTEPFVSQGRGVARTLGSPFQTFGRFMLVGWFANEGWLAANTATAQRFVAAMRKASQWANGHRAESGAMLAQASKLDPAIIAGMARSTYGLDLEPALLQPPIDVALRYGMMDHAIPVTDLIWRPSSR